MDQPPAAFTVGSGYPLTMAIDPAKTSMSRLWGIPGVGVLIRYLLAIPLYIVLWLAGIGVGITVLFSWIPILFTGRQAGWIYGVNSFYIDLYARIAAYLFLLIGGYPFGQGFGVRVEVDRDQHFNHLWGIPLVGIWVRAIILIPHYVVLFFLGIVVVLLVLVNWIPVLILGRQAMSIVGILGGYVRWYARVTAYLLLIASPYPPFTTAN